MRTSPTCRWAGVTAVIVAVVVSMTVHAQQNPRALFERARLLEENSRTLGRAVELYQQVVAQARTDRALAGEAALRIAMVYERQGRTEARDAFAKIARDYADQPAVLAALRARPATTTAQNGPAVRRLLTGEDEAAEDVSRDGRVIVGVTWGKPKVFLHDTVTGAVTTLVSSTENGWIRGLLLSPDGRSLAYEWEAYGARSSSLEVVETLEGATPRTIVAEPRSSNRTVTPAAWAPDGKSLLAKFYQRTESGGPGSLAWVSVADGRTRTIKSFEPWQAAGARHGVSPDGSSVAYSALAKEGSTDRYIYVMDADGQHERLAVSVAGANTWPVWTPDGTTLVFLNLGAGTPDLMAVRVGSSGGPAGEPVLLQQAFRGGGSQGTARVGGALLGISNAGALIYTRLEDPSHHEVIADRHPAGQVSLTFAGQGGTWSRTNKVAYFKTGPQNDLVVRSLDTGEERAYPHTGLRAEPALWFHDGNHLMVRVNSEGDPAGAPDSGGAYYHLDVATGTFTRLFSRNAPGFARHAVALSADDKTAFLVTRPLGNDTSWTGIVGVDMATGVERPIVTFPGAGLPGEIGMAISPDGATLAIQAFTNDDETATRLATVRTDGTGYHELYSPVPNGSVSDLIRWTPDGQSILFTAPTDPGYDGRQPDVPGWRVMRIAPSGGAPVPDGLDSTRLSGTAALPRLDVNSVSDMDLSPDGSQVLFSSRGATTLGVYAVDDALQLSAR